MLTIVSEEASLSSRQYSFLHFLHFRMNSSLQLMHCRQLVWVNREKHDHQPYGHSQSNHVLHRSSVVIHVSMFLVHRRSTYLGAQGQVPGAVIQQPESTASLGDWFPESNYFITAPRRTSASHAPSYRHIPLLPAPAIIPGPGSDQRKDPYVP